MYIHLLYIHVNLLNSFLLGVIRSENAFRYILKLKWKSPEKICFVKIFDTSY